MVYTFFFPTEWGQNGDWGLRGVKWKIMSFFGGVGTFFLAFQGG